MSIAMWELTYCTFELNIVVGKKKISVQFCVLYFFLQIRQFSGAVVSTKGHYMTEAERGNMGG